MTSHRQRVIRADGRTLNIVQHRGHLSYCFTGCCCGRTERGYPEVPVDVYKEEWTRHKIATPSISPKVAALAAAFSRTSHLWSLMGDRSDSTQSTARGRYARSSITSSPCSRRTGF